jgi:NADH-quinone oxidoreductase subunit J
MTFLYKLLFYVLAAVIVGSTTVAITRRNMVHAVLYLVFSFFGTAMLFYLLGAPLLAAFEVIIYAGAIMVLFLFVVMMIKSDGSEEFLFPLVQWLPAALFGFVYLAAACLMIFSTPGTEIPLDLLWAAPGELALFVFRYHWFSIEVISALLLTALIGALHIGRVKEKLGKEGQP